MTKTWFKEFDYLACIWLDTDQNLHYSSRICN